MRARKQHSHHDSMAGPVDGYSNYHSSQVRAAAPVCALLLPSTTILPLCVHCPRGRKARKDIVSVQTEKEPIMPACLKCCVARSCADWRKLCILALPTWSSPSVREQRKSMYARGPATPRSEQSVHMTPRDLRGDYLGENRSSENVMLAARIIGTCEQARTCTCCIYIYMIHILRPRRECKVSEIRPKFNYFENSALQLLLIHVHIICVHACRGPTHANRRRTRKDPSGRCF